MDSSMYSMMLCMWGPRRSGCKCSSCTSPVHTGLRTSVLGSCASANRPARYLQPENGPQLQADTLPPNPSFLLIPCKLIYIQDSSGTHHRCSISSSSSADTELYDAQSIVQGDYLPVLGPR